MSEAHNLKSLKPRSLLLIIADTQRSVLMCFLE